MAIGFEVRPTLRWRKPDSNFGSQLQRGQPYAELAPSCFGAGGIGGDHFISENDDFELPTSQSNLARRAT
jgi:hypothetical protein